MQWDLERLLKCSQCLFCHISSVGLNNIPKDLYSVIKSSSLLSKEEKQVKMVRPIASRKFKKRLFPPLALKKYATVLNHPHLWLWWRKSLPPKPTKFCLKTSYFQEQLSKLKLQFTKLVWLVQHCLLSAIIKLEKPPTTTTTSSFENCLILKQTCNFSCGEGRADGGLQCSPNDFILHTKLLQDDRWEPEEF